MKNNLAYQFGVYESETDSVLVICCKECNSSGIFDDPNDIVYLYHLAEESPLTYAEMALKENGLQDYVDGMNTLN